MLAISSRSFKFFLRSCMYLGAVAFVLWKPEVTPRKLAIVDTVTAKDTQGPVAENKINFAVGQTMKQELEDIDQAIGQSNLQERAVPEKSKKEVRREKYQRMKQKRQAKKNKQKSPEPKIPTSPGPSKALSPRLKRQKEMIMQMPQHDFPELPPLHTLIGDTMENITGNVQPLLDFAIVGFGKCGTTALIDWLDSHPEINTIPKEALHLARKRPALMAQKLYEMKVQHLTNARDNPGTKHLGRLQGFKNPSDVRRPESMKYLRQHWPETKLIITLRHPVHWFRSLYNFLVNEMGRKPQFLRQNNLIGGPHKNTKYAHTGKGEFHAILSLLGKTNMTDDAELDLLKGFLLEDEILNWPQPLPNPVFLLETTQMSDANETRAALFRHDLQDFLGLHQELPPVPHVRPGKDHHVDESLKIDMCQPENDEIRAELVRISQKASLWLRNYFLNSPDVAVSSREYLEEILATSWMQDPCEVTKA